MKLATEGRELITLDGLGVLLRGTYHRPPADVPSTPIGIVFLNSLSLPRAATGDSAVYWADSFAESGYPSFRFDLPGLGDTAGDIPIELLNFINAGKYGQITAAKVKELVARFQLSGVVLVGHCAGTVSAIFAATECASECKGLVLLDPYFYLPQAVRPRLRRGLSDWAMKNRFGGILSNAFDGLRDIGLYLRRNSPPSNANFPLLACWKKLVARGLPVLLIRAPARKSSGTKPRRGQFDYLKYVMQHAGNQVVLELIEGTDHSFANRVGRAAVRKRSESWLQAQYAGCRPETAAANTPLSENDRDSSHYNQYVPELPAQRMTALES